MTREELEAAGAENLAWLEKQELAIMGVPVFKIFAYEIIQMLNHTWLRKELEGASDNNAA